MPLSNNRTPAGCITLEVWDQDTFKVRHREAPPHESSDGPSSFAKHPGLLVTVLLSTQDRSAVHVVSLQTATCHSLVCHALRAS
jgi:hypothetical protein